RLLSKKRRPTVAQVACTPNSRKSASMAGTAARAPRRLRRYAAMDRLSWTPQWSSKSSEMTRAPVASPCMLPRFHEPGSRGGPEGERGPRLPGGVDVSVLENDGAGRGVGWVHERHAESEVAPQQTAPHVPRAERIAERHVVATPPVVGPPAEIGAQPVAARAHQEIGGEAVLPLRVGLGPGIEHHALPGRVEPVAVGERGGETLRSGAATDSRVGDA